MDGTARSIRAPWPLPVRHVNLQKRPDYQLTVSGLARALGVSRQTVNELLRERRAVRPEMALRLSKLFGNSPEFWLNLQREIDLWEAEAAIKTEIQGIKTLHVA